MVNQPPLKCSRWLPTKNKYVKFWLQINFLSGTPAFGREAPLALVEQFDVSPSPLPPLNTTTAPAQAPAQGSARPNSPSSSSLLSQASSSSASCLLDTVVGSGSSCSLSQNLLHQLSEDSDCEIEDFVDDLIW